MAVYITICFVLFLTLRINADKTCAARQIPGQSIVCVCNVTYCDEITRVAPAQGEYVAYTTSKSGYRFHKETGSLSSVRRIGTCGGITLSLDPKVKYQKVEGFGGAVTDAAGINWKNLTDPNLKQKLINSYFSDNGLQYNMLRVPIGGTDFSTHAYAYNEVPQDDTKLDNFALAFEDHEYKIPMIKAILAASKAPVHIVSTTWSPPGWMKSNNNLSGKSRLKKEYYQTYADYHHKFLEKYAAEGIPIWAITTTNEPINGVFNLALFNTLGWTPADMGHWIVNNLGPTIRNSTFKDLKIISHDDQRISIPLYFNLMVSKVPEVLKYIDGVGVHYYTDMFVPASLLQLVSDIYPDKFILATEACEGSFPWVTEKVILGSWQRAKNYILDIIQGVPNWSLTNNEDNFLMLSGYTYVIVASKIVTLHDMNQNVVGWIDWNLCLNNQGGPNWAKNFVDSPIIVFPENKEFIKQPMFYGLGHFSKFVPRGSWRIKVVVEKSILTPGMENVAFLTPYNTVVVIVYNNIGPRNICVKLGNKTAVIPVKSNSVVTIELPYEE